MGKKLYQLDQGDLREIEERVERLLEILDGGEWVETTQEGSILTVAEAEMFRRRLEESLETAEKMRNNLDSR